MKKHMTQEAAIKSAWMILEGLGYDRARNGDLEKTVTAVYESAPAADVVEVVRCCECAYHDDDSQYHYCRKWGRNCPNDSDFFCKWGKRMNGGQNDG